MDNQGFDNIGDVSSTGISVPSLRHNNDSESCVQTESVFTVENKGLPNNGDKGDVQLTRRGTCFFTNTNKCSLYQ